METPLTGTLILETSLTGTPILDIPELDSFVPWRRLYLTTYHGDTPDWNTYLEDASDWATYLGDDSDQAT
jgi:hypothetical protein